MKSFRDSAPPLAIAAPGPVPDGFLSIGSLTSALWRQRRVIALCSALGLLLGLVVAFTSTRLYVASASLIIDPPGISSQEDAWTSSDRGVDSGAVDSQLEVLRSERVAMAVAKALDLENDARFMDTRTSIVDRLRNLLRRQPEALSPEEEARRVTADIVSELDENVRIDRVGESYVLEVTYTSRYPDLAAAIANAYSEAYLQDQIGARVEAARNAGYWFADQISEVREKALEADLAAQNLRAGGATAPRAATDQGQADTSAQRIVQLRQLEREAETYRSLYQAMLGRYQNSIQLQSFPIASSRVVSPATAPLRPSLPRKSLVLALGLMAGTATGAVAGMLRELRDRSFRTGSQLRDELGVPCLGALPSMPPRKPGKAASVPADALVRNAALRRAIDDPLSPFADTLRGALAAFDARWGDRSHCSVGLLSALPDEGRSMVAASLALLAARSGARTLLVDGDLRARELTRAIAPDAKHGLADLAADPSRLDGAALGRACLTDPDTGLAFLPAGVGADAGGTVLQPRFLQALGEWAAAGYERVFVDLPAAALVNDARAAGRYLDGFLLVVRWGRTPQPLVTGLFAEDGDLRRKIVGSLLNDVDVDRLRLYADRSSPEYRRATA